MQITGLPGNFYRFYSYSKRHEIKNPHKNLEKYGKKYVEYVEKWEKFLAKGVHKKILQDVVGISQATYYRYKKKIHELSKGSEPLSKRPKRIQVSKISPETCEKVLILRKENPTYGKAKITVLLKREYLINIGESTVGRILKKLKEQGKIIKSPSALRIKKKRTFKQHAQKWTYGMKAHTPGELIQIDHMTVTKNGKTVKHFQAWDPITKYLYADVFTNATSSSAAKFLRNFIASAPFPIVSIQVDGGSEFMADFEKEAQKINLPLFVLPPRRPQWNGGVERGNRTLREEFYANTNLLADTLKTMRGELAKFIQKYNTYRPHFKLKGMTPIDYTKSILKAAA